MNKQCLGILVAITLSYPVGLWACDDEDARSASPIVHFRDGPAPITPPIELGTGYGNTEDAGEFDFRDYGPAHVTPPPTYTPAPRPNS